MTSRWQGRANTIGFFKVENDGFGLGAQRRPVDRNDLPRVKAEVAEYLRRLREGDDIERYAPEYGLVVEKERIRAEGDFNFSGERYKEPESTNRKWPFVEIGDVAIEIKAGFACGKSTTDTEGVPHIRPDEHYTKWRVHLVGDEIYTLR